MRQPVFGFSYSRTHYISGTRVREIKIAPIVVISGHKSSCPLLCDFLPSGYELFREEK
jgi:hypothetical protein